MLHTSIFSSQRASGFEITILSGLRNGSGVSGSGEDFTTGTYLPPPKSVSLAFSLLRSILVLPSPSEKRVRPYASQVQFPAVPEHHEGLNSPFLDIADSHYTLLQRLLLDEFLAKYKNIYIPPWAIPALRIHCKANMSSAQYLHQSTNEHERERSSSDLFPFQEQDAVSMRPIGDDPVIKVHAPSEAPLSPRLAIVHK